MIRAMLACVGVLLGGPLDEPGRPDASVAETYQAMKASAGRDAESQVKLALWCEAHGLEREKLRHLAVAVLTDPSHAMARGLLGLVEYKGKWAKPEAVAAMSRADVEAADLAAEYKDRRLKAPVKADAQYKLALWCIEKGLIAESRAHLATVVRLDPGHAEAWKTLGYQKVNGRWITDAMAQAEKAEKEAQARADKDWEPRLIRLKANLTVVDTARRAEARKEMAGITSPRAVPMVLRVFVEKGEKNHPEAVQLLGQIDSADSSRALALLALSSKNADARRIATETLRRRDPREFAGLLISMVREKIKFEVKPLSGPGSQGVLYVEGKRANLKRLYTTGEMPKILPGDRFVRDSQGNLVVIRQVSPAYWTGKIMAADLSPGAFDIAVQSQVQLMSNAAHPMFSRTMDPYIAMQLGMNPPTAHPPSFSGEAQARADLTHRLSAQAGPNAGGLASLLVTQAENAALLQQSNLNASRIAAVDADLWAREMQDYRNRYPATILPYGTTFNFQIVPTSTIPVDQMAAHSVQSMAMAREQIQRDVEILEAFNRAVAGSNARAVAILSASTGEPFGDDRKSWEKWFVNQIGYALKTSDESKPTIVEEAIGQSTAVPQSSLQVVEVRRFSCFGAGTPVQTINGPRPIESLDVGDRVLTQDTKSGKLGYHPILVVHRNPPSPTFKVDLDGQPVVSSHFHRFWVAGKGWVMARDLKVGDPIRTLGGVAKVTAIEADKVQPVFNLDVADDADFFAGPSAALVHDNTLPDLRQRPFDASQAVAAK